MWSEKETGKEREKRKRKKELFGKDREKKKTLGFFIFYYYYFFLHIDHQKFGSLSNLGASMVKWLIGWAGHA